MDEVTGNGHRPPPAAPPRGGAFIGIGIAGTFMGGVAALARELGHEVEGSDQAVYPPMSTQLETLGIALKQGYAPENISADPSTPMPAELAGAVQGVSGFRRPGYRGPAPPKPGRVHEYHFIVYALSEPLQVEAGLTKAQLLDAMKGKIIGQGEIVGTYERKPPQ